jgi:hypothetical protein
VAERAARFDGRVTPRHAACGQLLDVTIEMRRQLVSQIAIGARGTQNRPKTRAKPEQNGHA